MGFRRPSGTRRRRCAGNPALETPGYYQWSLRDLQYRLLKIPLTAEEEIP